MHAYGKVGPKKCTITVSLEQGPRSRIDCQTLAAPPSHAHCQACAGVPIFGVNTFIPARSPALTMRPVTRKPLRHYSNAIFPSDCSLGCHRGRKFHISKQGSAPAAKLLTERRLPSRASPPIVSAMSETANHAAWEPVRRELDRWIEKRLVAAFWLRDDDAVESSKNLERLRDLACQHQTRIGLAVIPGKLRASLIDFLGENERQLYPMCHGWRHVNHSRRGKPAEFGPERSMSGLVADARLALDAFCGSLRLTKPIFVPPYNRIAPALTKALPTIGFVGLSAMPDLWERKMLQLGTRLSWNRAIRIPLRPSIPRLDVHVDLIDWKAKTAHQTEIIVAELVRQLRGRRIGLLPSDAPIGLLTHHLDHDEHIWRLCEQTLEALRPHRATAFIDVAKWAGEQATKSSPRDVRVPGAPT